MGRHDPNCWLARHGVHESGVMPPCDGRLRKVHLIPRQQLKRLDVDPWDERLWVWGCGGPVGIGGHHGMLDHSRTLRIPRAEMPPGLEELALELELSWWLDRTYL